MAAATAVFVVLSVAMAGSARGESDTSILVLNAGASHWRLGDVLEFLDDPTETFTIDTVVNQAFRRVGGKGFTEGVHWYRFTILRPADVPSMWVLSVDRPTITDIRVYTPTADPGVGWIETRAGRGQGSPETTPITPITPDLLVPFDLPANRPQTFYVRLASSLHLPFDAALWQPQVLISGQVRKAAIASLHLGILATVFGVHLILGLWLRIGSIIAYAAFCASTALTLLALTGVHAVLFPAVGADAIPILRVGGLIAGSAALLVMWDRLLNLDREAPRLHRLYLGVALLMLLSLLSLLSPYYGRMTVVVIVANFAIALITLGLIVRVIRNRGADALWVLYGGAQIAFIASTGHKLTSLLGLAGPQPTLLPELAGLTHLVILSIAIALRMGRIVAARQRAETRVAELQVGLQEQRNFLAMVSHQLRSPLAVIAAAAGVLEVRPDRRDELPKIQKAVLKMRTFTTDLLSENRFEQARSAMRMETIDLVTLLNDLCEERQQISGRSIRLCPPQGPAVVEGDRALLGVLFANLLDNAIAYSTPTGEIHIEVACGDQAVTAVVADQGPGIAPDDLDHVFEKYYRSPTVNAQPGFGLGLYLVRRIAEYHGGLVRLQSSPAAGTRFAVTLPYRAEAPADSFGIGSAP